MFKILILELVCVRHSVDTSSFNLSVKLEKVGTLVSLIGETDHFSIGLAYSSVLKLDTQLVFFSPSYKRSNYKMVHFLAIVRAANS